jgi:protein phosphatase
VQVDFGALSHVGKVRTTNEDHYKIARTCRCWRTLATNLPPGELPEHFEEAAYTMAVADGLGGLASGEVASMMAMIVGTNLRLNNPKWMLKVNELEVREARERAEQFVQIINEVIRDRAQIEPALTGMGTTATMTYSVGDTLFVLHVGDSRAYLFRQGELRQLTADHTVAQLLIDAGQIEPEEAATHRMRHVLTNALGISEEVRPDIHEHRLLDGDRLLVCTDGLTEMVDDEAIAATLQRHQDPQAACEALVEAALEAGGKDNVTVLVGNYSIPAGTGQSEAAGG